MHRLFSRSTVVVIAVAALVAAASGCAFVDRSGAANAIGDTVRAMPGVSAAEVNYHTSFEDGAHFNLKVTLADTASDTQAAAVGRTFVDRMRAAHFSDFEVQLAVAYKANSDNSGLTPGASALFDFQLGLLGRGGAASTEVADRLALLIQVAQSPATAGVSIDQPSWDTRNSSRITVDLAPSVTDPAITDLIHAHPELASATWQISIPSPQPAGRARTYKMRGPFPSQQRRDLWHQIVDQIGPADAEADTDTVKPRAFGVAPTVVGIDLSSGSDGQQQFERIARAVTPLLPGLGLPVNFRLDGYPGGHIQFTLGGCDRPEAGRTPSALENELRRQYQHC
jgi:hypothetical protein